VLVDMGDMERIRRIAAGLVQGRKPQQADQAVVIDLVKLDATITSRFLTSLIAFSISFGAPGV